MKKTTITISYDEEKLKALKLYLEQKGTQAEDELLKALDTLYMRTVPAGVRDFIGLRSGASLAPTPKPTRKPKPVSSSAAGTDTKAAQGNG